MPSPRLPKRQPRSSALASTRERIDRAAYELFSRHGIRSVGVDDIVAGSGVAKMTLYKHYPSKADLALSFLRRREELWTRSWLMTEVGRHARTPRARLLAIFDVFDRWFHRSDFEGCAFARTLLEYSDAKDPVRKANAAHIQTIIGFVRELARDAGIREPDGFARQWQIAMMGSIMAAQVGDQTAARRAKDMARALLSRETGTSHDQDPP